MGLEPLQHPEAPPPVASIRDARGPLALVATNPDCFSAEFPAWLEQNLVIWRAFEREANKIRAKGWEHYSARTIVEYLRHWSNLKEASGDGWKINNNHVPDLARLYVLAYPKMVGFFSYRLQAGGKRSR